MEEVKIVIVTPEGVIFDGKALSITLPGADGEFGIYPKHAPLISLLKAGVIELVNLQKKKEYIAIDWGYVKVEEDKVDVLANGAVAITDGGKITENLEKAKSLLHSASSDQLLISSALSKLDLARR